MIFDNNRHNDSRGSLISMQSGASVQTVQTQKLNPLMNIQKKNEDPVVKMIKGNHGSGNIFSNPMNQSILRKSSMPKRPGPHLTEEHKRDLERHHLREGDFRRLLTDADLQLKYDERLNKASKLVKGIKNSVFEADRKMAHGEKDRQSIKLIFEAVEMLNELR